MNEQWSTLQRDAHRLSVKEFSARLRMAMEESNPFDLPLAPVAWRSPDNKPNRGEICIIVVTNRLGKIRHLLGEWIPRYTEVASDESDNFELRDDDNDENRYTMEGWYEQSLYGSDDCSSWLITDPVIAWCVAPRYEP